MKKAFLKKHFILALAMLFAFCCTFAFLTACSSNNKKFYTLEEAYKKRYLKKADFEKIAAGDYMQSVDELDLKIQEDLLTDYSAYHKASHPEEYANRYPDYDVDDFTIWRYWGEYHGFIIVQIWDPGVGYPQMVETITVAGIEIGYTPPVPLVWKIDS